MAAPTLPRAPTSGPSRLHRASAGEAGAWGRGGEWAGRRSGPRRRGRRSARACARACAREGAWPTARCARGGCPGRLGRGRGRDGGRRGLRGATRCGDPEIRTRGLAEDHAPARGAVVSAGLPGRRVGSGSGPGAQAGPVFLGSGRGPAGAMLLVRRRVARPRPRGRGTLRSLLGGGVGGAEGRPDSRSPGGRARRGTGCRTGPGSECSRGPSGGGEPSPPADSPVTLGEGVHPRRPGLRVRGAPLPAPGLSEEEKEILCNL